MGGLKKFVMARLDPAPHDFALATRHKVGLDDENETLTSEFSACGLGDGGDDPRRYRFDLLVGQRLLPRLQLHLDGKRFLSLRHAPAGEHIEHANMRDQ